jgi:hypothetical protein
VVLHDEEMARQRGDSERSHVVTFPALLCGRLPLPPASSQATVMDPWTQVQWPGWVGVSPGQLTFPKAEVMEASGREQEWALSAG